MLLHLGNKKKPTTHTKNPWLYLQSVFTLCHQSLTCSVTITFGKWLAWCNICRWAKDLNPWLGETWVSLTVQNNLMHFITLHLKWKGDEHIILSGVSCSYSRLFTDIWTLDLYLFKGKKLWNSILFKQVPLLCVQSVSSCFEPILMRQGSPF